MEVIFPRFWFSKNSSPPVPPTTPVMCRLDCKPNVSRGVMAALGLDPAYAYYPYFIKITSPAEPLAYID
jgi:hypothetical protein